MRLNAVKVLGISITNASEKEILEEIQKYLVQPAKKGKKPLIIFTPNTEQLVLARKNIPFVDVLNRADVSLPDTVGVVWASKILIKNSIQKPIPGVEFMEDLVELAAGRHVPIGLIGGRGNLAVETLNCLRQKHPILQDSWAEDVPEVSIENGSLRLTDEKIYFERLARRIVREGTRFVFVALGPPKQEYFIERLAKELSTIHDLRPALPAGRSTILMSVGGSFDIISGRLRRAPAIMRNLGLEWLWRLILEPWRICRQLALIEFVWLVLRAKLASKACPPLAGRPLRS
jgi:N-acetylglucosaminyldiphosphoundecaprenol N-acetyl-beta-D-mannosaminyltransferase